MNVASLELSSKLYKLSNWGHNFQTDETGDIYAVNRKGKSVGLVSSGGFSLAEMQSFVPAYSLSYLLRKLITSEGSKELGVSVRYVNQLLSMDLKEWLDKWIAYHPWLKQKDYCVATSPEDAVCKLLVKLIEQGLLKP